MPQIANALGSAQAPLRAAAAAALDALGAAGLDPTLLLQHYARGAAGGAGRGRAALADRIASLAPIVHASRPGAAARLAAPAAFSLLAKPRADARAAGARLLAALAALVGPRALEEQAAALPGQGAQQRVREMLAALRH